MDGCIAANNPSQVALDEGAIIWPGKSLDLLVSLGLSRLLSFFFLFLCFKSGNC